MGKKDHDVLVPLIHGQKGFCETCWHGKIAQDEGFVICKRYPPTIVFGNDPTKVFFPVILKTETCGEYKKGK